MRVTVSRALSCLVFLSAIEMPIVYAITWNVQDDFSLTANPNGPYSYGWEPTLGGIFSLYNKTDAGGSGSCSGVTNWYDTSISLPPLAAKNNIFGQLCNGIQPGEVSIHPGPNGEFSVIRWTSPMTGEVKIDGYFGAGHSGIMSYFVYKDGATPIFELHNTYADGPFSLVEEVSVGTTIDFAVGEGYSAGSTPLHAVITSTAIESDYLDVAGIPDVNGDGIIDQAVLVMRAGRYYLRTINGATGKQLKQVVLGTAANIKPNALTAVGVQISVLEKKSTGVSILQIRDAATLAVLKTFTLSK